MDLYLLWKVYDHDFNSFSEGVVIPHGIYDVKRNAGNEGYITLGTSKNTSEFCCGNVSKIGGLTMASKMKL